MTTVHEMETIAADLKTPLREAVRAAFHARERQEAGHKLHQIIVGPLSSGKTTAAHDYALALAESGLVEKKGFITIHYFEQLDRDQIEARFEDAKGGVIIIDDITRHTENASDPHPLTSFLWRALAGTDTTVILTGYKDKMEAFAASAPPEKRTLLPRPVEMERSFSFEERKAYVDEAASRRKARQEKRQVAHEWESALNIAVKTDKKISAPKKATFGKQEQPKS